MKLHLIIDLVLLLVALAIVIRCWRQGLIASVIRLGGTIAAYLCAWLLSAPLSQLLYKTFIEGRLLDYAKSIVPPELHNLPPQLAATASQVAQVKDTLVGSVDAALQGAGLADLPFKLVKTEGLGDRLVQYLLDTGAPVSEALVETIMKPAALTLTRIVVFIILFALASAVVSVLFRLGKGINHIPLVGGLNRLAGTGIGLLEAAITLYILTLLIFMAATLLRGSHLALLQPEVLERSFILSWVMKWRLPAGVMMFSL